jgi:hypothetical protein
VKIEDEDKALRLIWSLPSSYEHIKPVLIHGKETLNFEEVASKIIVEERRLKSEDNNGMVLKSWKYGKHGHVRSKCYDGAKPEKKNLD